MLRWLLVLKGNFYRAKLYIAHVIGIILPGFDGLTLDLPDCCRFRNDVLLYRIRNLLH